MLQPTELLELDGRELQTASIQSEKEHDYCYIWLQWRVFYQTP